MRIRVLALVVAGLGWTGSAYGQLGTLWLQGTDGSGTIEVGVSETAIIQLWLEIEPDVILLGLEAILAGYDSSWGQDLAFEVQGFIDHVNPGLMQRTGRGPIENDLPHGFISDYGYMAGDANRPYTENSGTHGPATMLLDEIIIAGLDDGSLPSSNSVFMNIAGMEPPVGWLECYPDPLGCDDFWSVGLLSVGTGSGQNPLIINAVPEPRTLGFLVLGALAAIRPRRTLSGH